MKIDINRLNQEQLIELRSELLTEAEEIQHRDDTDDRWEEINSTVKAINKQLQRYTDLAEIAKNGSPAARLSGDGAAAPQIMRRVDSTDDSTPMRDRAMKRTEELRFADNVDADATRERMAHLIEDAGEHRGDISAHIVDASSEAYSNAFLRKLRNPMDAGLMMTAEERDAFARVNMRTYMSEGSAAVGSALLPTHLDPTIILTSDGSIDPFRQLASVRQTYTNALNMVTSAGVTASWGSENTEAADASPTLSEVQIPVHRAEAFIAASFELVADSGVAEDLTRLLSDAKANLEAVAHVTGSGSGQPQGVVTALAAITASRVTGSSGAAGAQDLVIQDCYNVLAALPPRYRPNAAWVGENGTWLEIRSQGTGTNAGANFWTDLSGPALYPTLLGKPVWESSAFDSAIVSGSTDNVLALGDWRQAFVICDRVGMSVSYIPNLVGSNRIPTATAGWLAYWRTGSKVVNPNAARLLYNL
jgi:HK97 family phage major capsid protein